MKKIKVLIIDDSSLIRNIIRESLSGEANIEVVGEAENPLIARQLIKSLNPDVLTLDIEMPEMDGITFLANLMRLRPMAVIMLSTLTTHGADITLEALELGAIDFIAKPTFDQLATNKGGFKSMLIHKINQSVLVDPKNLSLTTTLQELKSTTFHVNFSGMKRINHLIALGASTGGTQAIKKVIMALPKDAPPMVIVQHIPNTFSSRFAERINEHSAVTVQEAKHGLKIKLGNVYIAPGDKHLTVALKGATFFCVLKESAPVNHHKPSVDVLFNSLQDFASNLQVVLLTGMGSDGAKGMLKLKRLGARTVIQDKESSLVWGMPGSAHKLNAHCCEKSLNHIAQSLLSFAMLDRNQMKEAINEYSK